MQYNPCRVAARIDGYWGPWVTIHATEGEWRHWSVRVRQEHRSMFRLSSLLDDLIPAPEQIGHILIPGPDWIQCCIGRVFHRPIFSRVSTSLADPRLPYFRGQGQVGAKLPEFFLLDPMGTDGVWYKYKY